MDGAPPSAVAEDGDNACDASNPASNLKAVLVANGFGSDEADLAVAGLAKLDYFHIEQLQRLYRGLANDSQRLLYISGFFNPAFPSKRLLNEFIVLLSRLCTGK